MPRCRYAVLVFVAALAACAPGAEPPVCYVAPNGSDTAPGTLARPFATLDRARQAVHELRQKEPNRAGELTVRLRGGLYELADTATFGPEDSHTVFEAQPGERPVLSGGRRLTGWKVAGGRWTVELPDVRDGKWAFTQLWVNGQRRYRPRLPKQGYYHTTGKVDPSPAAAGKGYDRFQYREGDIKPEWAGQGVELLTFHTWTMDRTLLAEVDGATRTARRSAPTLGLIWYFNLEKGTRYLLDNVPEALDTPGEWYLDTKAGRLTYLPLPGETPQNTVVVAPRLETIAVLKGDTELGLGVEGIVFRGLTFAYANWLMTPQGNRFGQAEVGLGGAVTARGARRCRWENCTISHAGMYGIELVNGCQDNVVTGCEITDVGAGGVKIGEQARAAEPAGQSSGNVVENCLIAHGGRLHPAGIGVWVGHSFGNRIVHNEIADFYYSGLSIGWSWGYGASGAHDNLIEGNLVHDIGQGVLSDMGGIYTLGVQPGTIIRGNWFHDIRCAVGGYGGWGVYLDEGTSDVLVEGNIMSRTRSPGFRQHYGRDNRAVNNIVAYCDECQVGRARDEEHRSFSFEGNIVVWENAPLLGENFTGGTGKFLFDRNLYWNPIADQVSFVGKTLAEWQAAGQDVHSQVADPKFADAKAGDFRLAADSPALALGFKPIDQAAIGRLPADGKRPAPEPVALPRAFPETVPAPPLPIDSDFENLAVGAKEPDAVSNEENETAVIRVTDETAAPGPGGKASRHSLKFQDEPGQQHEFNPHLIYQPNFRDGRVTDEFDLRVEQGTFLYTEWRDYGIPPYRVGPSLYVSADGTVSASGKTLFQCPWGQWMHVRIEGSVGEQADGHWDLFITLPGEDQPREYRELTYGPGFHTLNHVIFTANGAVKGAFYIDNVRIRPEAGR